MKRLILSTAILLILTGTLLAQGVQTGTIRGMVRDQQDRAVPGATVTATSSGLLGPRTVVSDGEGRYVLTALPPGDYQLTFELAGFATITHTTAVPLGLIVQQDVTLRAGGISEAVQVVAEAPIPIATPVVGMNFKQPEIEALATPRTVQGIAQLAPAVSENSPNTNQIVINGAFAFDSTFPRERRRRERQSARPAAEPVRRGSHRGDAGAHLRHLGGIRTVQRRRRQRHHEERRQRLFGQRPHQLPEPLVDHGDAV
jgi:hypothetical protein